MAWYTSSFGVCNIGDNHSDSAFEEIEKVKIKVVIIDFLKWSFAPSGIVCVEESGKLSWLAAIKNLFSGGVARRMSGPTAQERVGFARIGKELKRYRCTSCGVYFWAWRNRKVCYRFSCYMRRAER